MKNFEHMNADKNNELKVKHICEGPDGHGGVFRQIDEMAANIAHGHGRVPRYVEDILNDDPALREGRVNEYTYEARKHAMHIYRAAMNAIYARYAVDLSKSIARIEFRSSLSAPKPMEFMGVPAMGYRDEGEIDLRIEHFGEGSVGFVERHRYSKKENIGAGVVSAAGKPAIVGHPYLHDIESESRYAVPYDFGLSAYEIVNGKIDDILY